jgi:integrase/recombinase XerD
MKIDRNGKAKVLTTEEIALLFGENGFCTPRDRALFGICLYTACRIAEACALSTTDVYLSKEKIKPEITFQKNTTKGKLATRAVPVNPSLVILLQNYWSPTIHMFPGRHKGWSHIKPASADKILRDVCTRLNLCGVATHSFRRTALTRMHKSGIPLRVIQDISGIRTLGVLQQYLEVEDEQKVDAIASLRF